ncbi:hypothetical protein COR50_01990 [Chitinophaga caeni]|uniref:Transposase n=1 Tax=Chitinophaga caeni TaxID=2029983 RepID=A0A291QPV4_9BACT|nr:hypothetical protein [Chitinophaga caeni]ATL46028.1 hypothetical protein COR50_01990 [Chitinophaga caeni]
MQKKYYSIDKTLALIEQRVQGSSVKQVCKDAGITTYTYHAWLKEYQVEISFMLEIIKSRYKEDPELYEHFLVFNALLLKIIEANNPSIKKTRSRGKK